MKEIFMKNIFIEKKVIISILIGIVVLFVGIYIYKNIANSPIRTWEEALDKYIEAMIKKDRKKATSYTDTSYFTMVSGVEAKVGASRIEDLETYQENFIESVEALDEQVKSNDLDSYSLHYEIETIDPYDDDFGAEWVDVYFRLRGDFTANGTTQENLSIHCYRISLRKYPKEGWKVTWLYAGW